MVFYSLDYSITANANTLTATVTSSQTNDASKSLSEGHLSGAALVGQGYDLIIREGIVSAVDLTANPQYLPPEERKAQSAVFAVASFDH
jgi:hypothetical protein